MSDGYIVSSFNRIAHPDFHCDATTKRCFGNPKSPNYKYEYFGKNTPSCCATHLYTILKDVTDVLEENSMEYFISFGTLLGAVRHGGLIPWDTDVDILVMSRVAPATSNMYTRNSGFDVNTLNPSDRNR